ncbi:MULTISPECIES: hypothetical protein [unclassified Sulfitobacter]|uniref:hypothetical protein n=1 Tax=unclassified Sulfitobacter TaxID=196795 RepID=UPI0007C3E953|nr:MULTISPECIES: hypothetical protein [unclassified Sulfitobacter]KZX96359.1 hypothetical protein A3720_20225 [Sulfitobacter sp. HI0021]KZY04206.1 hypothetical protein A3722_19455 [Sulfitobacter sp. HI0027]KZZ03071.1 hypothetical protein A3747_13245 [Sulfitobacter sp. HI0076]
MNDLVQAARKKSVDDLFEHGGQEGSEVAYRHDQDVRRRAFSLEQRVANAQRNAARWQMYSAIAVGLSVVATTVGIWLDAIGISVR